MVGELYKKKHHPMIKCDVIRNNHACFCSYLATRVRGTCTRQCSGISLICSPLRGWNKGTDRAYMTGQYMPRVHSYCPVVGAICYSYTTSCCGLSGIHEAVIQLEAEAQPRLLIE